MIIHHTQLLQALINKYNLKSYLEIGVQDPDNNFNKIKCDLRVGVEPTFVAQYEIFQGTSDEYFAYSFDIDRKFDVIFIDGLHHADQVKRDFENALECLNDQGFILIHDTLPENEQGTLIPRVQRQWWGDVYKWAMTLNEYPSIRFKTFNIDNGCTLVWKDASQTAGVVLNNVDWEAYINWGVDFLNVVNDCTIDVI